VTESERKVKLSLEKEELLELHAIFRETRRTLVKIDKRLIAVERAVEALLRREEESERTAQGSDGWYS